MGGHAKRIKQMRNVHIILVGKPEMKKQLERTRLEWEDNFGMDVCKVVWKVLNWFHLAQEGQVALPCEYGNEPSGSRKHVEFFDLLSDC
jgi:hypothetical protein